MFSLPLCPVPVNATVYHDQCTEKESCRNEMHGRMKVALFTETMMFDRKFCRNWSIGVDRGLGSS